MNTPRGFAIKKYIEKLINDAFMEKYMQKDVGVEVNYLDIIDYINKLPEDYLEILFMEKV